MPVAVQAFVDKIRREPALSQSLSVLLEAAQGNDLSAPKMTYDEFLDWVDEDTLAEWVDGELLMTSPASDRHQDLVRFFTSVLSVYVETHQLGVIRPAPFQMKLARTGREPDLFFVANAHLDRFRPSYLDGPADVVVEIISLESLERDRGAKFVEYESAGVPEYWLIDPLHRWVECYQLNAEGQYETVFAGREGRYASAQLPGFWLRIEWLWQVPLPPILTILRELQVL